MEKVTIFPMYEQMSVFLWRVRSFLAFISAKDVMFYISFETKPETGDFYQRFCKRPNIRHSLSYVVKRLVQWPSTKERFAEDNLTAIRGLKITT